MVDPAKSVAAVYDRRTHLTTPTGRRYRDSLALLSTLPARAASGLVWIYQRTVSPALVVLNPTCGCRFAPTCSHYARGALAEHGMITGTGLTLRRLAKCGPWHPGGEDPVPPSPRFTRLGRRLWRPGLRRTGPPLACQSVRKAG